MSRLGEGSDAAVKYFTELAERELRDWKARTKNKKSPPPHNKQVARANMRQR